MKIQQSDELTLLKLWEKDINNMTPTTKFFYKNIRDKSAEFWTIEVNHILIGEITVFHQLEDKDFADGTLKAYLCAFRVHLDYQRQGFGTKLLTSVLVHLKEKGFHQATIAVDATEAHNISFYHKMGFDYKIKDSYIDPCHVDENLKPMPCDKIFLLQKNL